MIDLNQLKQLITFEQEGTITKAAEKLLISQPALTRSLQRLEEDLNIQLFERKKNKTSLTETGLYTVEQAKILLEQTQEFLSKIEHKYASNTTFFIGTIAPGIVWEVEDRVKEAQLLQQVQFEQETFEALLEGLKNGRYSIIVTDSPIQEEEVLTEPLFKEQLQLSLLKGHPLTSHESLDLTDLKGMTILLRTNLGTWEKVINQLTDTHFIRQENSDTFNELILASELPYFTTNITEMYFDKDEKRVSIPIHSPAATQTFYIHTLKKHKGLLDKLK